MSRETGPLRVLHVAEAFGGGLLEVVRVIAERCATAGHPAAIAYGHRPETPAVPREVIAEPVELFDLGWRRADPRSQVQAARRIRRLVDSWSPDVVHLHSSFAGVVGVLAVGRRAPTIFTPHAFASQVSSLPAARRQVFWLGERFAVRRASLVGAVDASEARVAGALGGRRVATVLNGIGELDAEAIARFRKPEPDSSRPRVMATGRIVPQRRPEHAARILSAVADIADVSWYGGGGSSGEYGDRVRAALAAGGVAITGWLPREQLMTELARATAYLHWTAWDSASIAILEAMARDTVVVASDTPPNRELLDPRQVCGSEEAAIALLRRVLTEPALRAELLDAQAQRRAGHSAEAMVAGWLGAYRSLAE